MRAGCVGGAFLVLCLSLTLIAQTQTGLLYLNEEPLFLDPPPVVEEDRLLVPIEAFALRLGLCVTISEDAVTVRGPGVRRSFGVAQVQTIEGTPYASLDWILELSGAGAHRIGSALYVSKEPASILGTEASSSYVTVRLSQFSASTQTRSTQGGFDVIQIRWPHSVLQESAQHIRLGEHGIQEVFVAGTRQGVELTLRIEPGTVLATEQVERGGGFAWTIRIAEAPSHQSAVQLERGITTHEWYRDDGPCTASVLQIEDWRQSYRLQPVRPTGAFPGAEFLDQLLQPHRAIAAISLLRDDEACPVACLIIHRVPYQVSAAPMPVFVVDMFGRWMTISSPSQAYLRHGVHRIPLDAVNRPLRQGEVVAYVPGYVGSIAPGITGTFLAVKIRDSRVVSVYQGPFVSRDNTTTLVVASGEAMERLKDVQLGDVVELLGQLDLMREPIAHAVPSGPILLRGGRSPAVDNELLSVPDPDHAVALATDWQGGLYLITFRRCDTTPSPRWSLWDILQALPTALNDAVLLSDCLPGALAYDSPHGPFLLGPSDPVSLALALIPLRP